MPTYAYECRSCGHRFDLFQPMRSAPRRSCPQCKRRTLDRLIGAGAGVIFKGSGFYQTDYRSAEYKKRAKEESGTSPAEKSGRKPGKKSASEAGGRGGEKAAGGGDAGPAQSGSKEK